ncbi:MAG: nucleotidyltransferase family protein, partial [Clostridia bacterium]|nr:nucleotidyltransferase family protein [Clostridia bacterium]
MMDEKQAFRLLITLLKYELLHERLPEDLKASIDEEVVKLLYLLAKRFDYAHTVGDILAREGLLSDIGKSKFKPFQYLSFYRYERLEYEISELRRVLNAARIPFMPLKGTVLRHRYPDPVMRVSCDIDILVPYDQAEMARDVLVKELSYRDDGRGDHDYQLYTPSELTVELHFQLYKTVDRVVYALGDVWEHAERLSPDGFEYAMSGDYFYAYMMTHMAKHFHEGGCGLKPFADLYVMKTYMPYDRPKAQAMLKEAGLLTFANEMEALCDYWFAEGDMPVMYDVTEE